MRKRYFYTTQSPKAKCTVGCSDAPWARGPGGLSNTFVGFMAFAWGWFGAQSGHQAVENVGFSWVSHSFLIAESRLEGNVPYGNRSPAWSSSLGLAPNALPSGFQIEGK